MEKLGGVTALSVSLFGAKIGKIWVLSIIYFIGHVKEVGIAVLLLG